ncbi:hypothetical protein ABEB36_015224 [Hypothenemus hampei]|uniref:Uncharacterized protein n=1 Tax=Hypothenemus hampei TaxID=57062 RepID=A0ABD1E117_HYPHA
MFISDVPSPLGAVRGVWLLLVGEFKLKSRGSSAVSKSKEGFTKLSIFIERSKLRTNQGQTEVCRRCYNFSSHEEGRLSSIYSCPNCPLDPKGPSGGIFRQKRDKHGRYRARQCIQLKRDAR